MTFAPETITLHEAGPLAPYRWLLTTPLTWSGTFRGRPRTLKVDASEAHPFTTDLASVPRSLTWLFPRYGKYTKAAVLHDYLCQNFSKPAAGDVGESLQDRSDADEVFRVVMKELGVPWLRRRLMWAAVTWATLMTSLIPGRRSKPVLRRVGRGVAVVAVLALILRVVADRDLLSMVAFLALVPGAVLVAGTVALGRGDRARPFAGVYLLTFAFSGLLLAGVVGGALLVLYLFIEDALAGLPALRGFFRDLFSEEAKLEKLGTPQFARLAAVIES